MLRGLQHVYWTDDLVGSTTKFDDLSSTRLETNIGWAGE